MRGWMRRADGSLIYGEDVRSRTAQQVDTEAMQFAAKQGALLGLGGFSALDADRLERLDRFVEYVRRDGCNVLLFLPPMHPLAWQVVSTDPRFAEVVRSEGTTGKLAERHGVPIVGSFDAGALGLVSEDFYDGMHPKEETVRKLLRPSIDEIESHPHE